MRRALDGVVEAVAKRHIKPVAAAVSEQYADGEGNDKKQILALLRAQLLLHPNLHLLSKVTSVESPEPGFVRVIAYAAMASVSPGAPPDLRNLSADVCRFELTWADEGGAWRVNRAAWAPALARDLF